jgi:hypothetical protein
MSFVILQAIMKRLEERRRVRLFAELGSTMKLPRSGRNKLSLEVIELADQERPPMIRIPEYLERRQQTEAGTEPVRQVTAVRGPRPRSARSTSRRTEPRSRGSPALIVDAGGDRSRRQLPRRRRTVDEAAAWWHAREATSRPVGRRRSWRWTTDAWWAQRCSSAR